MLVEKYVGKSSECKTKTQNLNQKHRAGIINEMRSMTTIHLHKLLEGLLINAPDSLFEYMSSIEDQKLLTIHFNVMRGLKLGYRELIAGFDGQMTLAWKALLLGKSIPSLQSIGGEPGEKMTCFSRRAYNRYSVLLDILETNIAALINAEKVFHPLCPNYLYLSFWHATGQLGLGCEERLLIVPLFSRFVTDSLGTLLADTNNMLVDKIEYGHA